MSNAGVTFVSWVRRGIATSIETTDGPTATTQRVTVPITVQFNSTLAVDVRLGLHGPGEVVGFDERAIIRRWPAANSTEAEANLFPLVELDQADLPWRYTPARANARDRLRPWLCLIVLTDDEIAAYDLPRGDRRLSVVTVRDGAPLPRLDQSWAWAHVQLSGSLEADADAMHDAIRQQPHAVFARLLCPRQLRPNLAYSAMLVPTFEQGRRAGLRQPLTDADNALAPAWTGTAGPVRLPVYHQWRFTTGPEGDFESLVRRLAPRSLPGNVGIRDLDVSRPGAGLPAAARGPLGLEGALRAPSTRTTEWSGSVRDGFVDSLEALVDLPADVSEGGGTPVVAPPLYGRWYALEERLRDPPTAPWFELLNSDPRHRVAAGLGTQVIQAQERVLLAAAWEQVGELREINNELRHAQFAREVSGRLHARLFVDEASDQAVSVTRPLHARVLASPSTMRAVLDGSPVPEGLLESAWRRVARPGGPIGKRQGRPGRPMSDILDRVNQGTLTAAPPVVTPEALPTHQRLADRATAAVVADALFRRAGIRERQLAVAPGVVAPETIAASPARPTFVARDPVLPEPSPASSGGGADSQSARLFRIAAEALARDLLEPVPEGVVQHKAIIPQLYERLKAELDPRITIAHGFSERLRFPLGLTSPRPDVLEPVILGPEFPQPMYKALAELSPSWVIPGLENIPADTVALAVTNPPFIEAFMVGLNQEMSRELVWNEYPTSQRKTYFRQFWDPAGVRPLPGGNRDALKDIHPIHRWSADATLGENGPRPVPPGGRHLVVIIRGELFRRYPRTIVTAVRAQRDGDRRTLSDDERTPVLSGSIAPDLAFFGFDLGEDDARGTTGGDGWYIVLQEQLSEPRFGLDVPKGATASLSSWSDLSWGHLVAPDGDPALIHYIDLDSDQPITTSPNLADARWHADAGIGPTGARAADLAYITLQQAMRVAIHAADMLPEAVA